MPDTLTHIINPFKAPRDNWQFQAQKFTFEAIRKSSESFGTSKVKLLSAQYKEDREIIPDFFENTPDLSRSISDLRSFQKPRKLPFLADIFERLVKYSESEYLIFTNSDIIPSRDFYAKISEIIDQENTSFSINRRTVPKTDYVKGALEKVWKMDGKPHLGHDCFIIPRETLKSFMTDRVITGVPWVGFIIILNMALRSKGMKVFQDMRLTRHLGDDMVWSDPSNIQFRNHNSIESYRIMERFKKMGCPFSEASYLGKHYQLVNDQISKIPVEFNTTLKNPTNENRFIFSINPGRAGSEYLSMLLGSGLNVTSFHEAEPQMHGIHLENSVYRDRASSIDSRKIKLMQIESLMSTLPPGKIYAETNHMFIKSFYDIIMSSISIEKISVVILRRDPAALLESFFRMGYFSEKNRVWPAWMHRVPSIGSIFKYPEPFEDMDTYNRIICYLIDIEIRAELFKQQYPECNIVETNLEDLQTIDGVKQLFNKTGITPTPLTYNLTGKRINKRTERKKQLGLETTKEYCRQRILEFIDNAPVSLPESIKNWRGYND